MQHNFIIIILDWRPCGGVFLRVCITQYIFICCWAVSHSFFIMADRRNHGHAVVTKQTVAEKNGRRNSDVRTSGSKWPNISAIDLNDTEIIIIILWSAKS